MTKITIWDTSTGGKKTLLQKIVSQFNQTHPRLHVEVNFFQNDPYKQKIQVAMGAHNPPDIFFGWGGGVLQSYVNEGDVYDLTPAFQANPDWPARFFPSVLKAATFNGKTYAIPNSGIQPVVFYYNKDIGLQGVVYAGPDSPWQQLLRPFLDKKARLGIDSWGSTDAHIRHILQPIEETFAREFPNYHPFPFGPRWMIGRVIRAILLAEPLVPEFAAFFKGLSKQDIDTLLSSFQFHNCTQHSELINILAAYSN